LLIAVAAVAVSGAEVPGSVFVWAAAIIGAAFTAGAPVTDDVARAAGAAASFARPPWTVAGALACRGGTVAGSRSGRAATGRRFPNCAGFTGLALRARRPAVMDPRDGPVTAA
jgi:hypothetical protein